MGGRMLYKEEFPLMPLFPNPEDSLFLKMFYSKSTIWKHEDEYRLIHRYQRGKIHKLKPQCISEIIFGCKIEDRRKIELINLIMKKHPHVKFFETKHYTEKWGLDIMQIA